MALVSSLLFFGTFIYVLTVNIEDLSNLSLFYWTPLTYEVLFNKRVERRTGNCICVYMDSSKFLLIDLITK